MLLEFHICFGMSFDRFSWLRWGKDRFVASLDQHNWKIFMRQPKFKQKADTRMTTNTFSFEHFDTIL